MIRTINLDYVNARLEGVPFYRYFPILQTTPQPINLGAPWFEPYYNAMDRHRRRHPWADAAAAH